MKIAHTNYAEFMARVNEYVAHGYGIKRLWTARKWVGIWYVLVYWVELFHPQPVPQMRLNIGPVRSQVMPEYQESNDVYIG